MRTSRDEWRKRVESWKDSGLTAEQYACELGINAKTLQFWKHKLAKPKPSARRARRRPRVEAALPLIEVQPTAARGGAFEVEPLERLLAVLARTE